MSGLRPDQQRMVDEVAKAYGGGLLRVLLQMPTGAGKTHVASLLLKQTHAKKKRGMFTVHLDAIIEDTIKRFKESGFRVGRVQAGHEFDADADVYVASMATMLSRDFWPKIDFLIYDECFVAGTLVDGRPIEHYRIGDSVRSYNHEDQCVEVKRITRVFRSKAHDLIRVVFRDSTPIVCTKDHPFFTSNKIYESAELTRCAQRWTRYGFVDWVVDHIESVESDGDVFNLEVEDNHNYFVDDVLVHNCHHGAADGASTIFQKYDNIHILGLSATPETSNGRGLDHLFQKLIVGPQPNELIAAGILVPPKVYCPYTQGKTLARDPVEALAEFAPGRQSVVFARNGAEARDIQSRLKSSALYLDSTSADDRVEIMNALRSGSLQHAVTVRAILEGADVKCVSAIVTCSKFASPGAMIQAVGRGVRSNVGKIDCIHIDLMGACLEWGLPNEDRFWKLEGKASCRIGTIEAPLKKCKMCLAIFESGSICPRCGAGLGNLIIPKQSKISPRDMRLLLPEDAIKGKAQVQLDKTKRILMLKGMFPAQAEFHAKEKAPVWIKEALGL